MDNDLEKKMSDSFKKMTENSEKLIPSIWEQIENKIDFEKQSIKEDNTSKVFDFPQKTKKKQLFKIFSRTVAVAALLSVVLLVSYPSESRALFNNIFNYFGSDKEQDFFNRNTSAPEEVDATFYESKFGYVIFLDKGYFDIKSTEESDIFVPKKGAQNSYFEVKLLDNTNAKDIEKEIYNSIKEKYEKIERKSEAFTWNYSDSLVIKASNESLVEKYLFHAVEGKGTYVINMKYLKDDLSTSSRYERMLEDFKILDKETLEAVEQGITTLYFEYDENKYELVQIKGDKLIMLMDKERNSVVYASFEHIPSKDMKTAANDYCQYTNKFRNPEVYRKNTLDKGEERELSDEEILANIPEAIKVETDLNIDSIKVLNYRKSDDSTLKIYFINDNRGGTYKLLINHTLEANKLLKNIKIVPKEENINLTKIKKLDNIFA